MHWVNDQSSKSFKDYEMFIDMDLEPNEVTAIKIVQTDKELEHEPAKKTSLTSFLEIVGFTDNNEVLFKYTNKDQDLAQTFGVTLKYYKAR